MINLKRLGTVFFVVVYLLLSGCGTTQYLVDNKSYTSSETALDALRITLKEIENELQPIDSTPKEKAVIITPSKKACKVGLSIQGHLTKEHINYLLDSCKEDYASFANFLIKSNLFASVDHVIDDYPHQYVNKVNNDDYAKIYLEIKSPTQVSWFISVPPENTPKPLSMDKMAENETLKIQSWLNDVKNHLQGAELAESIVVAVTDFDNTTGRIENDWLRIGLSEFMSTYFSTIRGIKPVARSALEKVLLKDSPLKLIKIIDEDSAPKIGKQVGAEYIIIGSYQTDDKEITVNTRLLKTDTGKVLRVEQETGKLSDIDSLVRTLVLRIAGVIGQTVSDAEKRLLKEQGIQMMKVIEGLSKGQLSRQIGDLDSARQYYKEALANDPTNEVVLEHIKDIDVELKSIGIVDFKNNSKETGFDHLSNAIPEELTTLMIRK
ncbi:MAG: FlgO family outer membrane protein, partial [Candidatus Parabeggiatoa sp.]|nr:FlgO family outer membrane protein [Candidatus Parabeggiatoa sp.]